MSNTYLCIDKSGSTVGETQYWEDVGKIIERNADSKVIFWDTNAYEEEYKNALEKVQIYSKDPGAGSTDPQCFATILPEGELIIK